MKSNIYTYYEHIHNKGSAMPKLIEDVKKKILDTTKELLLSEGYGALTLRIVAKKCGIAVGTIYNYYSSKNMLVASVMMEDWQMALEKMSDGFCFSHSVKDGFETIYNAIVDFGLIYEVVWFQFSMAENGNVQKEIRDRHQMLRKQISNKMKDVLVMFGKEINEGQIDLLAEAVLAAAMEPDIDFQAVADVIVHLF